MASFVEVRDPHTGKLLFRFDAGRDLIEIQKRGKMTVVDLSQFRIFPTFAETDIIELDVTMVSCQPIEG